MVGLLAAALMASGGSAMSAPAAGTPVWAAVASPQVFGEEKSFESAGATLKGTLFLPKSDYDLLADDAIAAGARDRRFCG